MCHGLRTARVARPKKRFSSPRLASWSSSAASSSSPSRIRRKMRRMFSRIARFSRPISSRNAPDTTGPMSPVAWCRAEPPVGDRAAQPADAQDDERAEREHDARVPEREEEPDAQRALAVVHQLARRVVDRRDVVGVEGVAQAERVGGDPDADAEGAAVPEVVVVRRDDGEQQEEADAVQGGDRRGEDGRAAPFGGRERGADPGPAGQGPSPRSGQTTVCLPGACCKRLAGRRTRGAR